MELLILPDPGSTHATVRSAGRVGESPAGAHVLRPGESYEGVPYDEWRVRLGQTVDVVALQSRLASPDPAAGEEPFHPAPDDSLGYKPPYLGDYGFIHENRPKACTRDELIRRCERVEPPTAVWTPDSPWLQLPEEVPVLREAMAKLAGGHGFSRIAQGWVAVAGALLLAGAAGLVRPFGVGVFLAVLSLVFALLFWMVRRSYLHEVAQRLDPKKIGARKKERRYLLWLAEQPAPFTLSLAWVIAAVGACQLLVGDALHSVEAGGLVKPAVRAGEIWRLATGMLLHGSFLHGVCSWGMIEHFGRRVEAHAHRAYVPLVFLVAGLAGGAASTLLVEEPAAGAFGGVMGLVGFLMVAARRLPGPTPPTLYRELWIALGGIVAAGVLGLPLIDNAAHAGGFVAGAAVGLLAPLREGPDDKPVPPGVWMRWMGTAAGVLITAVAVFAILRMFGLAGGD